MTNDDHLNNEDEKIKRIKQLSRVVCICKGIPLGKVLPGIQACSTVEEVNRMTGTGSGNCRGERCGPRIRILLRKKIELQEQNVSNDDTADDNDE